MTIASQELAARLANCFAIMNEAIEVQILTQLINGGDAFCSYSFDVDDATLRGLGVVLTQDERLWIDFQQAVLAHRKTTHWTMLLEHVYAVGCLVGKLRILENGLSCPCPNDRRKLAECLNGIDAEIATCRELADRRNLAERINRHSDFPLIDGLSLRGLTYVFGEHADLWHDFQMLVERASIAKAARDAR